MMRFGILIVIIFLSVQSCGKKAPVKNFDSSRWIGDKNGCLGERIKMVDQLQSVRESLPGLQRGRLIAMLGKPDNTELYSRGQLIYRYHISPSKECQSFDAALPDRTLEVRLNALGVVSEVNIVTFDRGSHRR